MPHCRYVHLDFCFGFDALRPGHTAPSVKAIGMDMDALELIAWLQEYRDHLKVLGAPPLTPSVGVVQRALLDSYVGRW